MPVEKVAHAELSVGPIDANFSLKDKIYDSLKQAITSMNIYADDVELRLDEVPLEIIAQCVNSDKPDGPRKTWRHGIKFVLMSEDARNRIHKEILRRERALLKLRAQIRG
jgi:hypothetical protein